MNSKLTTFLGIMGFYILLSYLIGPVIFYYVFGKTLQAAGNGFIVGSILSILLWHFAGSKMI